MAERAVCVCTLLVTAAISADAYSSGNWVVYGVAFDRNLFSINLTRGTVYPLGLLSLETQAADQDPENGRVYYFQRGVVGTSFDYWNPQTGQSTRVRKHNPAPGFYAKRMAFSPDGTLYLMDANDFLWIIDKVTGDLTYVGPVDGLVTGMFGGTGDIAFGPDGTLYLNTYRNVYTVDLATLSATLLYENLIGRKEVFTGLAYCGNDLYASTVDVTNWSINAHRIVKIDLDRGAMSTIAMNVPLLNDLTSCPYEISPATPAAPMNLAASAVSDEEALLQWENAPPSGEVGYRIERRGGAGPYAYVGSVPAGTTTYHDIGLTASTAYTYRIFSFNEGGESNYSNEANVTTHIYNNPPMVEILQPEAGASFTVKGVLSYVGDATDVEDGALPASAFTWDILVGSNVIPVATGTKSGTVTLTSKGSFTLRLIVTDSAGKKGSKQINFTVN